MNSTSSEKQRVYIGLGSNQDGPVQQLQLGLEALQQCRDIACLQTSPFYQSAPWGPIQQDDFVNAVLLIETGLSPYDLLFRLQAIERQHKRVRKQRWGPRTLDLDILLYGQTVLDDPVLTLPHPRIATRGFVLYPLADITPELCLPSGEAVIDLIAKLGESRPRCLSAYEVNVKVAVN